MKNYFLQLSVLVLALLVFTGCGGDSQFKGLLEQVPANSDVVAVLNVKTLVENAGGQIDGSTVKLPQVALDVMGEDAVKQLDELNAILKDGGVDINVVAIAVNNADGGEPVVLGRVTDRAKLVKTLEGEGFKDKGNNGGVAYYEKTVVDAGSPDYNRYCHVAVTDNIIYMVPGVSGWQNYDAEKSIGKLIADAKESNMAGTPMGKRLVEDNLGGVAFKTPKEYGQEVRYLGLPSELISIYEGSVCIKGSLDGSELKLTLNVYDSDGKAVTTKSFGDFADMVNSNAKISSKALSYMGKDESFIFAIALKNMKWDEYFDMLRGSVDREMRMVLPMLSSYLEKIDGTVAIGVGVTDGLSSFEMIDRGRDVLNQLAFTLVVQTKEGKAKTILSDIKGLMDGMRMPYTITDNGIEFNVPGESGSIYAVAESDVLVLSNSKIESGNRNPVVKAIDFTSRFSALGLFLGNDNKIMKDLGLDNSLKAEISADASKSEGYIVVDVDGGKGSGLVEKLLYAGKALMDKFGGDSPAPAYESEPDSDVVEEALYVGDADEWGE